MQTSAAFQLDVPTFQRIRRLVHDKSGIALREDKLTLVSSRLATRVRELGVGSYSRYLEVVEQDKSGAELTTLLNAISTNVTSFFRESDHFDFLGRTFDAWKHAGQRRFRFWCAASSSGEEPFTWAMTLLDRDKKQSDWRILATDISTRALARATNAVYSESALSGVPGAYREKYLAPFPSEQGASYQMTQEVRDKILFRQLNLKQMPFPLSGPLDVVMCRNVMIYFDEQFRSALIREFHRLLKPGGYLLISHTESLVGINQLFSMESPSIYLKRETGGTK